MKHLVYIARQICEVPVTEFSEREIMISNYLGALDIIKFDKKGDDLIMVLTEYALTLD